MQIKILKKEEHIQKKNFENYSKKKKGQEKNTIKSKKKLQNYVYRNALKKFQKYFMSRNTLQYQNKGHLS